MRGHKIGLTSRAMQQASQIDEPDYGTLLDDMFFEPRRHPVRRASSRRAWRWSWPSCSSASWKATARQRRRRAGRHRVRDARHRDHRRAHRAVRPPHQGDAQGVRHHHRQRGQRRHRARRAAECKPREVDLPWCGAILLQERRGRGNRPGRRRAGPSRHRRGLAGDQAGALGRVPAGRRGGAGRLVHAAGGRRRRATASTPTTARSAASNSSSSERHETGHAMQTPINPFKQALAEQARRRSACGSAWPTPTPPRSAPAPASTGC